MTDRLADKIAQKFQEAAPKFADAFHADSYELYTVTTVRNEYGESVASEVLVESGYCALVTVNRISGRRVESGIVFTETAYQVEILPPTAITTNHRIHINDRAFEVSDVQRGGEMDMFVIAALEEAEAR